MTIQDLRKLCNDDTIQITAHVLKRCHERGITLDKIMICIMNGEIIEDYPSDFPFPSALVLEYKIGCPMHVVAGIGQNRLWIITAYYPDLKYWERDFKTRKEH